MLSSFFTNTSQDFVSQQSGIEALQQQLATGLAVPTAGANPAAFVGAARDTADASFLSAETAAQTNVQTRLGAASSALQQASTVLDHIQTIALQAINGTEGGADYQALSAQVGESLQQLISVGNTQGSNGNYVFAGTAKGTEPFVQNAGGSVQYFGNDGLSMVKVSPGISVNAALSGSAFTGAMSGNGYTSLAAAASNSGTATVLPVGISNQASASTFQQGTQPISLVFSKSASGALVYKATQGSSSIGSGAAASGQVLSFAGTEFKLSGTPGSGDSFTIAPARPQTVFALAQAIQTTLSSPGNTPALRALSRQVLGNALAGLEQYQGRVSATNARVGVVLQTVQHASSANAQRSTADQVNAGKLTAADAPAVMAAISQQISALQAAFKAFGLTASLSVFTYL